jgi:hypothetical protein
MLLSGFTVAIFIFEYLLQFDPRIFWNFRSGSHFFWPSEATDLNTAEVWVSLRSQWNMKERYNTLGSREWLKNISIISSLRAIQDESPRMRAFEWRMIVHVMKKWNRYITGPIWDESPREIAIIWFIRSHLVWHHFWMISAGDCPE